MAAACPVSAPDAGFVRWVLSFVDCQAQSLGADSYLAMLAPGSTLSLVLTGFLTLFVAMFGYRLLLGHSPDLREGVMSLVKLGFVVALATSWPAYRTLVYDVALRAPAELTADVGVPAGLPGAGGGLVDRLDVVDQAMAALSILGAGEPTLTIAAQQGDPAAQAAQALQAQQNAINTQTPPPPFLGFNAFALGGARLLFLLGAVGSLAAVRLVAGLMLALGPFFIAFLLFDQTRGLFEGWVRVLAGAALAAVGSAVALGLELSLLEPWLADILTRRTAGEPMPNVPAELFLVAGIFALVLVAMIYASSRLAFGFRLAPILRSAAGRLVPALGVQPVAAVAATAGGPAAAAEDRSRAAMVVDAISSTQRREAAQGGPRAVFAAPYTPAAAQAVAASRGGRDLPDRAAPAPLGQSYRRSTRTRVSGSARRRDRNA